MESARLFLGDAMIGSVEKLCFLLGTLTYASDEYRDLVSDLIDANVLVREMHDVWMLLEPPGMILNPKADDGFVYFAERVYAEAYMGGLIRQMGGPKIGPFRFSVARLIDPAFDGVELLNKEMDDAVESRELPPWMTVVDGGKDEKEGSKKFLEGDVRLGSGFSLSGPAEVGRGIGGVPENLLQAPSDDRGGVRSGEKSDEEDVEEGVEGEEEGD